MFMPTHYYSPKEMLARFPNARSLVILHDRDDIEEISLNSFFKFIIGDRAYDTDFAAKNNFNWLRDNVSFIFDEVAIDRPENIPPNLYSTFVELRSASVISSGFHLIDVKPQYEHCVNAIQFKDIIGDPDKVLQQLSEFTRMPVTDFIRDQYLHVFSQFDKKVFVTFDKKQYDVFPLKDHLELKLVDTIDEQLAILNSSKMNMLNCSAALCMATALNAPSIIETGPCLNIHYALDYLYFDSVESFDNVEVISPNPKYLKAN
jgi:hypothetical protein